MFFVFVSHLYLCLCVCFYLSSLLTKQTSNYFSSWCNTLTTYNCFCFSCICCCWWYCLSCCCLVVFVVVVVLLMLSVSWHCLIFGFVFKEREIAFILVSRTWLTESGHYSSDFKNSKTHRTVFKRLYFRNSTYFKDTQWKTKICKQCLNFISKTWSRVSAFYQRFPPLPTSAMSAFWLRSPPPPHPPPPNLIIEHSLREGFKN